MATASAAVRCVGNGATAGGDLSPDPGELTPNDRVPVTLQVGAQRTEHAVDRGEAVRPRSGRPGAFEHLDRERPHEQPERQKPLGWLGSRIGFPQLKAGGAIDLLGRRHENRGIEPDDRVAEPARLRDEVADGPETEALPAKGRPGEDPYDLGRIVGKSAKAADGHDPAVGVPLAVDAAIRRCDAGGDVRRVEDIRVDAHPDDVGYRKAAALRDLVVHPSEVLTADIDKIAPQFGLAQVHPLERTIRDQRHECPSFQTVLRGG